MLPSLSNRWMFGCLVGPVSLFVGLMIATAGAAVWPPVTGLATPLICQGEVEHKSEYWSVRPGEQGISRSIYCVTGDGAREDITIKAMAASFFVYSAIAFVLLSLIAAWTRRSVARAFDQSAFSRSTVGDAGWAQPAPGSPADAILGLVSDAVRRGNARVVVRGAAAGGPMDAGTGHDPAERLATLKQLLDDGLIDPDDYEAKKAEILSGL